MHHKKETAIACIGLVSELLFKRKMERREFSKKLLAQRDMKNEPGVYKYYLRMDADTVRELLLLLALYPQQEDTTIRNRIPTEERLVAILRYLATGRSHECLKFSGGISPQSLATIISETRRHIYEVLREKYLKLSDRKYRSLTYSFILTLQIHKTRWQYSNCEGALDGKHIRIVCRKRSGVQVYNYNHFHSKVLMGMVNSYICSSTSIFVNDHLNLPQEDQNIERLNFVFDLHKHVMKQFNKFDPTYENRTYNCQLSKARNVV
ncbi:hypothetical protein PR048_030175 [Dryococelus australis]|uniref:DDE Tnp4 domain-containing protein n=1 Tax=Dryococelus australis TaxID=614101 RepID=A0ABQ9GC37_9NEOP|nr:hypothetical protein PR048_030175 [Dryococelus australis]